MMIESLYLKPCIDAAAQVLCLGAGFDTTWFQLQQDGLAPTRYLEVDFKEVRTCIHNYHDDPFLNGPTGLVVVFLFKSVF